MHASSSLVLLAAAVFAFGLKFSAAEPGLTVTVGTPPPNSDELVGLARLEIARGQGVGGLSGLIWQADDVLTFASDRGHLYAARLLRDAQGRAAGLADWREHEIELAGGWSDDFEGLAESDGNLVVSVEERPYVMRFSGSTASPGPVQSYLSLEWLGLPTNQGFEALTDLPDDGWLTFQEGREPLGHPTRTRGGQTTHYRAADGYAPTGADRDGDRIIVLERRLSLMGGWQARVSCITVDDLVEAVLVVPREIARLGILDGIDNLEGIAVRRRGDDLEMLLVSDDNMSALQRTLLLHYVWPDGGSGGCVARPHQPAEGEQQQQRHRQLDGEIAQRPADPGQAREREGEAEKDGRVPD